MSTYQELLDRVEAGDLDDRYAEYIMNNCHGERVICNGDTLILSMEDGYLFNEFLQWMFDNQ